MGSEGRGSINGVSWDLALITGYIMVVSFTEKLERGTGWGKINMAI